MVGYPVAHSRSPEIHHAFAADTGVDLVYDRIELTEAGFADGVRRFFEAGGLGLNVTLPHKLAALGVADAASERARQAGAANTLRAEPGGIHADNTDGAGLLRDLSSNLGVRITGARILVLGASGAARGAVAALLSADPGGIVVANRDPNRARRMATDFPQVQVAGYQAADPSAFDLVINATSASLKDSVPPLLDAPCPTAYDMVYRDGPTAFQRWALDHGSPLAADGWGMLVEQAAESWVVWGLPRPETAAALDAGRVFRR